MRRTSSYYTKVDRQRRKRAVLLLALFVVLLIIIIVSCTLLTDNTLKIGLYESSRPLSYLDEKKNITGFEADFAKLLAEKADRKVKLRLLEAQDIEAALMDGSVDCVLSVRESVHSLIGSFKATEPIISYGVVIVVRPDDESIESRDDLLGKKVGVMLDSDAELLCEEFLKRTSFNVRKYDIESQPFHDLKLKKVDAIIADELYARFMQLEDPDSYRVVDAIYLKKQFGLRLSRKLSQAETQEIEGALFAAKSDPKIKALFLEWFGYDLT